MLTEGTDPGPAGLNSENLADRLDNRLGPAGLRLRGGFLTVPDRDQALLEYWPSARSLILIGNVGDELWRRSGAAIRARLGPHPLNGWIRETLEPVARDFGARILFDFEGPPWWPFQQWAMRAERVYPSPLGLLIHPIYGLWHAYRAALLFDREIRLKQPDTGASPCVTCDTKPCLRTCPVQAFTASGYDVGRCARHLFGEGKACRTLGCQARNACPIGAEFRYSDDQANFHMEAFVTSLRRRGPLE